MAFLTALTVRPVRGSDMRVLTEPLIWVGHDKRVVSVPVRFETNYASIPQFTRWLVDNDDPCIRDAAVIHDYLYTVKQIEGDAITRAEADAILIEAMHDLKAPWWMRQLVWVVVRARGGSRWNS